MTAGWFLIVIGVILMIISAFFEPPRFSLWRLGWALVVAGALLFGNVAAS